MLDSHFHLLSLKRKGYDIATLKDISGLDIGTDPHDIDLRKPLIEHFDNLLYSIAAGPWCLKDTLDVDYLVHGIEVDIINNNPSFLGEIGLDYFHLYGNKEKQSELFIKQLLLANKYNLPVVIHNRDSNEDVINLLEKYPVKRCGMIHCFSADEEFLNRALRLGFYISFAGNITYKNNASLASLCKKVPIDRLLLETDSPYLSPQKIRGGINTPEKIIYTYEFVSKLLNIEIESLKKIVKENFYTLASTT